MELIAMQPIESITSLIQQRFSCRTYLEEPISDEKRQMLLEFIQNLKTGPFGGKPEFHLVAAKHRSLRS